MSREFDEDIRAKFMDIARRSLPKERVAEAMGLILSLGSVAPLTAILRSAEKR